MANISPKSKKTDILDAYNDLLDKVKNEKKESCKEQLEIEMDKKKVEVSTGFNSEKIVNNLAQVKLAIARELDTVEKKLVEEYNRLSILQDAIAIEDENLDKTYQIKKNAYSLEALLLAQKEQRANFDDEMRNVRDEFNEEMETRKEEWDRTQFQMERDLKDRKEELKKKNIREEDEYSYDLLLNRKKDQDAYSLKKTELEKELKEQRFVFEKEIEERRSALLAEENELKNLRVQAEKFPEELERAVKNAEKTTKENLEKEFQHTFELKENELDGKYNLQKQMINVLESKIKEQDALISVLTKKTDVSQHQVQTIALKALERSSFSMSAGEMKKSGQISE